MIAATNDVQQKPEENKPRMSERVMKALRDQTPTEVAVEVVTGMMSNGKDYDANQLVFNSLCSEYLDDKAVLEFWKDSVERSRTSLQAFVDRNGFVPTGADKTIRYATAKYQADVTRAVPTEINDDHVEEFQSVCRRGRVASIFPLIFTRKVTYSLAPHADKVLAAAKPSKKFREAFYAVYGLCFTPKPKSPSLTVVDAAAEQRKREASEAAKAAKKAEKKSGKAAA